MALPVECELQGESLVFWTLARPSDLEDSEKIYDHTCFVACTNGLRPLGAPEVLTHPYPELAPGTKGNWGRRSMTPESIEQFRTEGYVLAELRLPVAQMGGAAMAMGALFHEDNQT